MNIKEIYKDNQEITFESYLNKYGIKDITEYLNPTGKYIENCYLYNGIIEGVQNIKYELLDKNGKIFIIQDGDTDGICSAVMLYDYLMCLNSEWNISVLIHTSKQRGLDDEDIMQKIRQDRPNLVIIPDAGTNNREQAEELCEMSIGLLVLDHHDIDSDKCIEKGCLINNQDTESKVQRNGSGALVTHKFLQALDNEFNLKLSPNYVDLVALSLVSDSMDMSEMENRTYYYYGIQNINCVNNVFLKMLIEKFIDNDNYSQRDISFKIVPKLNSICRSQDQVLKQRLFLALLNQDNLEEVLDLCEKSHKDQIENVNKIIEHNKDDIEKASNNNLVILSSRSIPRSYSGLVCGKIMNMCDNKPTIVGSTKNKNGKPYFIGSLRSPIPLRTELSNNELVDFAQGHEESCGIGIYEYNIPKLIEYFNSITLSYEPCIEVLKSYSINNIPNYLFGLFDGYDELWTNKGLPKPLFYINNIIVSPEQIDIIGSNSRTLKIHTNGCDIMIFNTTKNDKLQLGLGYYDDKDKFVRENKNIKLEIECIGLLNLNVYKSPKTNQIYKTNQIIIDRYNVKEHKIITPDNVFKKG